MKVSKSTSEGITLDVQQIKKQIIRRCTNLRDRFIMSALMNDLRRMGDLVSNMRENWGMLGLPTCFQFSNDGKKLYFLADTSGKGNEIHYVNISDEGAHLFIQVTEV